MADPMDRADRIGYWVSGVAHAGLIGVALVGGALFRPQPLEAVRMAEVATMSEAEFQSLAAAAAGRGPVAEEAAATPAQPRPPRDENRPGAVEATSPPTEGQAAELTTPSDRAEAQPDLSEFRATRPPVAVTTDAPQVAQPENTLDMADLPQASDRPDPARNPAQSPAPVPQRSAQAPVESARPRGRPEGLAEAVQARRASAEAARQREAVLAREAEEAAAAEAAAAKAQKDAARRAAEERAKDERREAAAKAEAEAARKAEAARDRARRAAEAEAEAAAADEKAAEKQAAEKAAEKKAEAARRAAAEKAAAEKAEKAAAEKAEKQAAEKKAREEAEKQAAAEKAAAEAAAEKKAKEQAEAERKAEAAKKAALAEAKKKDEGSAGSGGGGAAANGPPLSQGEKDGFRVAVEQCWNRGSLSTEASQTTVSVRFSMAPDGTVEKGSLRMIGSDGGSDAAAKQAYEAARRAILMCERGGYKLPPEKYNRWKDVIIDFNASGSARVK